jgi:hypothetical protein
MIQSRRSRSHDKNFPVAQYCERSGMVWNSLAMWYSSRMEYCHSVDGLLGYVFRPVFQRGRSHREGREMTPKTKKWYLTRTITTDKNGHWVDEENTTPCVWGKGPELAVSTAPASIPVIWGNDAELLFDAARIETEPVCGYCRDCKWWQKNNYNSEVHRCELTESPPNSLLPKSKAIAKGDYYHANLETQSDFACNQWKAKEEQP